MLCLRIYCVKGVQFNLLQYKNLGKYNTEKSARYLFLLKIFHAVGKDLVVVRSKNVPLKIMCTYVQIFLASHCASAESMFCYERLVEGI